MSYYGITYPINKTEETWYESLNKYLGAIYHEDSITPSLYDEDYYYLNDDTLYHESLFYIRHCTCERYLMMNKGCKCGAAADEKRFKEEHKRRMQINK